MSPSTMKAARVTSFNKPYSIETIPIPSPGPGDLLLRTTAAGFCHTDNMALAGGFEWAGSKPPVTGSHEPVGIIASIGEGVKGFNVGERVGAVNFYRPCKSCPDCKKKQYQYCPKLGGMIGLTLDGAFAEYVIVDADLAARIPDGLESKQAAPLMCAGATIFGAIKACKLSPGSLLGISGIGALGHLGIQFAKCMGYKVVAIDTRQEPLDLVTSSEFPYPPDAIMNPKDFKTQDSIASEISTKLGKTVEGYEGLDSVIVATDALPAYEFATKALHNHGLLVVLGQPEQAIGFRYPDLIFRDIRVHGCLLPAAIYLRKMLDMVAEKGIKSELKTYKLEDVNQMVEDMHKPGMKGKLVVEFEVN